MARSNLHILVAALVFTPIFTSKAQYSDAAPTEGSGKPWTVTATVREEYDDNIFTTKNNRIGSFVSRVTPSFVLNYPIDQTLLSGRYNFGLAHFENRSGSDIDTTHEFTGRVAHSFTPRFDIDIREYFIQSQEPEVRNNVDVLRRQGDYFRNQVNADLRYGWTERFSTVSTYNNEVLDYHEKSAANTNNRMDHTFSQDFRFTLLPTTTLSFMYQHNRRDFNFAESDSTGHIITAGVEHNFTPQLSTSLRVGSELREYSNPLFESSTSPYVDTMAKWSYDPKSFISFGYNYSTAPSDVTDFSDKQSHIMSLGNTHYLTALFSVAQNFRFLYSDYEAGQSYSTTSSGNERTWVYDVNLGYELTKWCTLEAGYSLVLLDSSLPGDRDYDRNRYYIGARFTY